MFANWLSAQKSNQTEERHAVLGSLLRLPLLDDQEEAIFACGCFWGLKRASGGCQAL